MDDELAKDLGKESLAEVKTELEKSLIHRKEREFRNNYAETVKTILLKDYNFEIPQTIVDEEVKRTNTKAEEVAAQIRLELILDAIAAKENIQATQNDVENRLTSLSQIYRQPVAEIRKLYAKNNMMSALATQIVLDKTLDFIIDNAKLS